MEVLLRPGGAFGRKKYIAVISTDSTMSE